jgi:hypothetical protein
MATAATPAASGVDVQTAITLFTLTVAALTIPGSKLTDIWAARAARSARSRVWPATGSVPCWPPSRRARRITDPPRPGAAPRFDTTGAVLSAVPNGGVSPVWLFVAIGAVRLSRSVSNLGSSLGTALVGSILVAAAFPAGRPYAASFGTLTAIALVGLGLAPLVPRRPHGMPAPAPADSGHPPDVDEHAYPPS